MAAFNRDNRSGGGFRGGGGGFRDRNSGRVEMHKAVCDNCGKDCEVPFRPTSGKPIFCKSCFENQGGPRNSEGGGRFDRSSSEDRQMFDAVCDECGNNCKVPFRPSGDKPIYCSNCFETKGGRSRNPEQPEPQFEKQLKELNDKMDKILKLLSPDDLAKVSQEVAVVAEKLVEEVVEETPKKAKKSKKAVSDLE